MNLTAALAAVFSLPKGPTSPLDSMFSDLARTGARAFAASNDYLRVKNGKQILSMAISDTKDDPSFRLALEKQGFDVTGCFGFVCSGYVDATSFRSLTGTAGVNRILPEYVGRNQAGSTVNDAVEAHRIDEYRDNVNSAIDGTGMKIGVLSDSFNVLGGYAQDIATGDLPDDVQVLQEISSGGRDEGRAMMQLIYDMAPNSELFFWSAFEGQANFAEGIIALAAEGCDVAVDDIIYFAEPMFQDGIITQATTQVVTGMGVPYFSSAGNSADTSWEGNFVGSGQSQTIFGSACEFHDFGGGDVEQTILAPQGGFLFLQWSDPFFSVSGAPGATRDLNILVVNAAGDTIVNAAVFNEIGSDPFTAVELPTGISLLVFCLTSGSPASLKMKTVFNAPGIQILEHATFSSTSYGKANGPFSAGVGAANFAQTPEFGEDPALSEPFTSLGGTEIIFEVDGTTKTTPEVRQQPRFTAADGTATSVAGFGSFFGTSAAAPHAAAIALLMLQINNALTPDTIYGLMADSSLDMNAAGYDFLSGAGFVDGFAALTAAAATLPTSSPVAPTTSPVAPTTSPVAPTTSPVAPTTSPVAPTTSPVAPTTSPVAPTTSPVAPTTSPVAPTTSPVAPTTSPVAPTTSPAAPTAAPTTDPVCLSGSTTVQTKSTFGEVVNVPIRDVKIGDKVMTKSGTFQSVYAWAHFSSSQPTSFFSVHVSDTRVQALEITGEHLIYLKNKKSPVRAASLQPGDVLLGSPDMNNTISRITVVQRDGFYGPLTPDGTLVVANGIVASSYSAVQHTGKENVELGGVTLPVAQDTVVHLFFSPLRFFCFQMDSNLDFCTTEDGLFNPWAAFGLEILAFVEQQVLPVQVGLYGTIVAMLAPFVLSEFAINNAGLVATVGLGIVTIAQYWRSGMKSA